MTKVDRKNKTQDSKIIVEQNFIIFRKRAYKNQYSIQFLFTWLSPLKSTTKATANTVENVAY